MNNTKINNKYLEEMLRYSIKLEGQFPIIFNSLISISKNNEMDEKLKKAMMSSQMQYICETLNFNYENYKYIDLKEIETDNYSEEIEMFKKLLSFSNEYNKIQKKLQKYKKNISIIEEKIKEIQNSDAITLKDTEGTLYEKKEQLAAINSTNVVGQQFMGVPIDLEIDEKKYNEELKKIEENKQNTQKQIDNLNGLLKFYKDKIDKNNFNYKM